MKTAIIIWTALVVFALGAAETACGAGTISRIEYPPSHVADELQLGVTYTLWIPDGVAKLRGIIVHQHVSLSDDPRVQRITAKEYDEVFKKHRYDDTAYMQIKLKSESGTEMVVEFSNMFGWLAGHGYRLEFCRRIWGLRTAGKMLWIS